MQYTDSKTKNVPNKIYFWHNYNCAKNKHQQIPMRKIDMLKQWECFGLHNRAILADNDIEFGQNTIKAKPGQIFTWKIDM